LRNTGQAALPRLTRRHPGEGRASTVEQTAISASLGFIVIAAGYLGNGVAKGAPPPYPLSASSAAAVVDLWTAAKIWRRKNSVADNGRIFL